MSAGKHLAGLRSVVAVHLVRVIQAYIDSLVRAALLQAAPSVGLRIKLCSTYS
jgi:hypothetical protein